MYVKDNKTMFKEYIILIGVRRIFTSDSLNSLNVAGSAGKSKTYSLRVGRRGKEAWLAVEGLSNVSGQAIGSMTQLDVSPVLYIGMLRIEENLAQCQHSYHRLSSHILFC